MSILAPSSFMSASVRLAAPSLRVLIILSVKSCRMVTVLKSLDKVFEFPLSVDVAASTCQLHATNVETVTVDAGMGDDEVTMIGSAGSNRLHSYADYSLL